MSVKMASLFSAVVATVSLQSGCSFLFVNGPPVNHADLAWFDCSDSNAWPVIDAIWAGLNGIGAASAAGDNANPNQGQIVGVGIAWLVVSGVSAISGFSKVSACNDAKRLREQRSAPRGVAGPETGIAPVSSTLGAAPLLAAPVRTLAMRPAFAADRGGTGVP